MDPADTSSFLRLLWARRSGPFARCSPSYLLSSSLERGNNTRAGQKRRGTEWGKFTEDDDTWAWQSICICVWWNKCSRCRKHERFSPYVSFKALFITRNHCWLCVVVWVLFNVFSISFNTSFGDRTFLQHQKLRLFLQLVTESLSRNPVIPCNAQGSLSFDPWELESHTQTCVFGFLTEINTYGTKSNSHHVRGRE